MKPASVTLHRFLTYTAAVAAAALVCVNLPAQTVNWTGGGGDGLWSNPLNWDLDGSGIRTVPAEGTNAVVRAGNIVTYATPMTATSFASLTNAGALTVNASGFNIEAGGLAPYFGDFGGSLVINSGGLMLITNAGDWRVSSNHTVVVEGGALIVTNNPGGTVTFGPSGNQSTANAAGFTNNAGTVVFDQAFQLRGRFSRFIMNGGTLDLLRGGGIFEGSNDQERPWLINGGVANLGEFSITRTTGGGGLVISNGVVTTTSLRVGTAASRAYATIYGGVLTNTGTFFVSDRSTGAASGDRRIRFLVRGGTVVSTDPGGIVVCNQANANAAAETVIGAVLEVSGGVLTAEGITLVLDNSLVNAWATLSLSGSGVIYLGSGGLNGNAGAGDSGYFVNFNGGTLAAKADNTINADVTLGGTTATVQAADAAGNPFSITCEGVISGGGVLVKTGGGTLTLNKANLYTGNTVITAGRLALGTAGAIASSPNIFINTGATFDISAASGFTLGDARTVAGNGSVVGDFALASGATINPGSNVLTGTLSFGGSVTQTGGAINHFDLSANPAGPNNDLLVISGDLNVSGLNTIEAIGGGNPGTVYPLIRYGGDFNGSLANFKLIGANGSLSNNTSAAKGVYLIVASTVRGPTSVAWAGNSTLNDWDAMNRTNWLNNGALDFFVNGDSVRFDANGAVHPLVNLVGNVAPAFVTVDAAGDYTFKGDGSIVGTGGLTKTNSGRLTILTTNTYSGATTIGGGVVEASTLANGGVASSLGAASFLAANLVLDGGTLRYLGEAAATDRAATIGSGGAVIDVAPSATILTLNGTLTGDGRVTKAGAGTLVLAAANAYGGGTLNANGVLQVNVAGALGAAGVTNINGSTLRVNAANIALANAAEFTGNSTLDLANAAGNTALTGAWTGDGTVNIVNLEGAGRTFTIGGGGAAGGHMWGFSGTVSFGTNDGFLRINNDNSTYNFGSSNALFDIGTGMGTLNQRNGGTTTHLGALKGGPGTKLSGRGGTGTAGTNTYSIGGKNLDTTFEGEINDGSGMTAITKVGKGRLTLTGTSIYTGVTTVEDGTMQVDGTFTASPVTVVGGVLSGTGNLGGAVDVQVGGTCSPGTSIGTLTINNSLALAGNTLMEVSKGTGWDQIAASSIAYGGTLTVTNAGGALTLGESFQLFSTGSASGNFTSIVGSPGAGLAWSFDPMTGNVTVVARTEPPKLEFVQTGSTLQFSWSGTYKLQAQTNALNVGLSTNWGDYPGGATSGISVPIDSKSPAVFFRLTNP